MNKGRVLITGASAGIGAALAREFANRQFDLVITARREDRLTALAEELRGSVEVDVLTADLASDAGVTELLAKLAELPPIDILVNNAGVAASDKFEAMTPEAARQMLGLNVIALTALTQGLLPGMLERGSGKIMNVASVAGFQPVPSMTLYAATKSFVLSFTEGLSEELRGTGVSISALCPGLTRTEMVEALNATDIPPFMMSTAEEVAREGVDALLSGEVIRIPGFANQAAVTWAKHQPRWLVRGLGGLFARFNPINH